LRKLRPKVSKAEQKRIDLNLRMLRKSYHLIKIPCPTSAVRIGPPFGQWFTTTNPK
jgi:hypothetical protein